MRERSTYMECDFSDKLAVVECAIVEEYETMLGYGGVKWCHGSEDRNARE